MKGHKSITAGLELTSLLAWAEARTLPPTVNSHDFQRDRQIS